MTRIIDVSYPCEKYAAALRSAGVETVMRYYTRDSVPSAAKRLHRPEALALSSAGLRIGIVYEGRYGDDIDYFDNDAGLKDGAYARMYAQHTIEQPAGTAIYFGVDTDADPRKGKDAINKRVIPYFEGVAQALAQDNGGATYLLGVYGSGAVCQALLEADMVQLTWLAQSTGWTGYKQFLDSRRWTLLQAMDTTIAGVRCDPNTVGAGMSIGDFVLPVPAVAALGTAPAKVVNARNGLRLREGPGTEFGIQRLLPYGTQVHSLATTGTWTSIDLQGDGVVDGYVNTGFLIDGASARLGSATHLSAMRAIPEATPPAPLAGSDAPFVLTLIDNGSSIEGIAAARKEAKSAVAGYPKNGCAAHLSALLRQSGIMVEMTIGAGKLAARLEKRGWTRIDVGQQQPGDVGAAYDSTDPPGSDHVYLVIKAIDDDRMLVTDNQNTANEPHTRSAHGRDGKTATEYFLRP